MLTKTAELLMDELVNAAERSLREGKFDYDKRVYHIELNVSEECMDNIIWALTNPEKVDNVL